MVWERLSATPGLTGRGCPGSPHSCYHSEPAVHAGLDAPGRNPGAARTPRCGARCLRAGDPAHACDRGVVYAGATAMATFTPVVRRPGAAPSYCIGLLTSASVAED